MSGIPKLSRADLAREDKVLEKAVSQFPKCLAYAPGELPASCDPQMCNLAAKCDRAISESLRACGRAAETNFRHETGAIEWIANAAHKEKHLAAHQVLTAHLSSIAEQYAPERNRFLTIEAIGSWGNELREHMKSLDLEMRSLWAKRETQVL